MVKQTNSVIRVIFLYSCMVLAVSLNLDIFLRFIASKLIEHIRLLKALDLEIFHKSYCNCVFIIVGNK